MPGARPSATKFAPYFASSAPIADVADQREPEAAADGVTVERADDGHLDVEQREERLVHRVAPLVRRPVVARRAAGRT